VIHSFTVLTPIGQCIYCLTSSGEMVEHFVNLQAPLSTQNPIGRSEGLIFEDGVERDGSVQRVFFSGEHCSEKFFGYVHGAWLNGLETGKEVADCVKGNCVQKKVYKNVYNCVQR